MNQLKMEHSQTGLKRLTIVQSVNQKIRLIKQITDL